MPAKAKHRDAFAAGYVRGAAVGWKEAGEFILLASREAPVPTAARRPLLKLGEEMIKRADSLTAEIEAREAQNAR